MSMNNVNDFSSVSALLIETEKAINTLKGYQRPQIEMRKNYILGQVCNYIYDTLKEANWMFCSVRYFDRIAIMPQSGSDNSFILYVGNGSPIGMMRPVATLSPHKLDFFQDLSDKEADVLVRNWADFKKSFNYEIHEYMVRKQKELDKEIQHLAHMQDELNNFKL